MLVKPISALPENGRSAVELSELSTPELVALAQAGDREAFAPLFRRYGRRVLTYAIYLCDGDAAMADDVASDVWARTLERIGQWRPRGGGPDDFVRWLFGMVRTTRLQTLAAMRRQLPGERRGDWYDWEWLAAQELAGEDWEECPDKQELTARLHTEIGRLSRTCRDVVRMRLSGADGAEIAQVTGLTSKQVGDAWRRAQVELRRRLVGRLDVDGMSETERRNLRELAQELPPISREVALLRLARVSVPEIAVSLGMTRTQTHNAWRHAEDLLRKLLDDPIRTRQPSWGRMAAWQKERDRLNASVDLLSPGRRSVAQLRLTGLTHPEIAEQLGCPVGTVASTWRDALDQFTRLGLLAA